MRMCRSGRRNALPGRTKKLRDEKWIGPLGNPLDKIRPIQGTCTVAAGHPECVLVTLSGPRRCEPFAMQQPAPENCSVAFKAGRRPAGSMKDVHGVWPTGSPTFSSRHSACGVSSYILRGSSQEDRGEFKASSRSRIVASGGQCGSPVFKALDVGAAKARATPTNEEGPSQQIASRLRVRPGQVEVSSHYERIFERPPPVRDRGHEHREHISAIRIPDRKQSEVPDSRAQIPHATREYGKCKRSTTGHVTAPSIQNEECARRSVRREM